MEPLLSIQDLSVDFISEDQTTQALKNISFSVNKGEIVALVGESGSGKSVTSLSVLQLIPSPPAHYRSGAIYFSEDGKNRINLLDRQINLRSIRGNKIAMIFQEPMTSLNPVITCGQQIMEALQSHRSLNKQEARAKTLEWLKKVQLPHQELLIDRYPHQLSGGQKQRISIASALAKDPAIVIFDDCLSAVDAKTEKEIIGNLNEYLKHKTSIIITHRIFSLLQFDKIIVLEDGEIAEQGTHAELLQRKGYYAALYERQQKTELAGEE